MTKLLLRLFIKDHCRTQDPAVRAAIGSLAGIVGIVCNGILFLLKLVAGLFSGSVAMAADAFNNLSDAASSVTTLLGFRMARQPADKDHPFGHARYEYLSGLVVAMLILLIGAELAKSSLSRIFDPQPLQIRPLTYWVLLAGIGLKLWLSLFFRKLGKLTGSGALSAAAADSLNDILATAAVLAGCVCQELFHLTADGYVGLAVAAFILVSGIGIARQTISPLLGQQADEELLSRVTGLILSHDKVLGVHDLLVHDYGPGQCFASVHVEISADEDPIRSHDIIDHIERDALAELNVHLVIHYDPVLLGDDEQQQMHQLLVQILEQIHPDLSVHDFRLVRYARQKKLVFDLEVPYSLPMSRTQLQKMIDEKLIPYYCVSEISFDAKE